ncbi:MAG: hypothetical protein KC486_34525 [Myxococcales bacterium]|nr:hypothetical protein [Myxococcales bacterium]
MITPTLTEVLRGGEISLPKPTARFATMFGLRSVTLLEDRAEVFGGSLCRVFRAFDGPRMLGTVRCPVTGTAVEGRDMSSEEGGRRAV